MQFADNFTAVAVNLHMSPAAKARITDTLHGLRTNHYIHHNEVKPMKLGLKGLLVSGVALGMGVATSALADSVSIPGTVPAINTLTQLTSPSSIGVGGTLGFTTFVSGVINNNDARGWDLQVDSANLGKLIRSGSSGGSGNEIAYTNIKFIVSASNTGTLGTGLSSPAATRNVTSGALAGDVPGTTHFFPSAAYTGHGTATTATVNYAFELQISAAADTSLLEGSYTDTITLTLTDDTN